MCAFSEITLPKSLRTIGEAAFSTPTIKSITIPQSVKQIGNYAFGFYGIDYDEITEVSTYKKVENYTISGCAGSAAEKYAKINGFTFIALSNKNNGDVNGDGTLSIADATAIQKCLASITEFTPEQLALADFNGDGVVNVSDSTAIQRALVNS